MVPVPSSKVSAAIVGGYGKKSQKASPMQAGLENTSHDRARYLQHRTSRSANNAGTAQPFKPCFISDERTSKDPVYFSPKHATVIDTCQREHEATNLIKSVSEDETKQKAQLGVSKSVEEKIIVKSSPPIAGEDQRGSQSHRNRQTLRKRKAVEVDEHSYELLPAKKSNVEHVAEWDIPAGTSNVGQYIVSEVAKGKDATVVLEQTRDLKEKKTKRRRKRKAAKNKGKRMDEDLGHFITDVEFDTLFLQFDKSPLGSLDQLVRRPIVVDINNDNWFSSLQKVPDEPVCPRLASRIGPQYQARVARFGAFRDKQGGNYLPE